MPEATCDGFSPARLVCGGGDVRAVFEGRVGNALETPFNVDVQGAIGPTEAALTPITPVETVFVGATDEASVTVSAPLNGPETNDLLPCPGTFLAGLVVVDQRPVGTFAPAEAARSEPLVTPPF